MKGTTIMSINKSVSESVEVKDGEVNAYIVGNRASLGIEQKQLSINFWLTTEELKQVAEMINKALEQA